MLFRRVEPSTEERFKTCLPLVELEAAAGAFSEAQALDHGGLDAAPEWVELRKAPKKARKLAPGMFVAQVRGRSMEPKIPDGAYCIFRSPVTGTRKDRVVLATARDLTDPEHGGRYTVKIYQSTKEKAEDGTWRHEQIVLRPINKTEFEPIELGPGDDVAVLAELVVVLG
ncbi:MAG: S24 family peptidase [bacterium]|nr:S24 family peptidase [bacterium]